MTFSLKCRSFLRGSNLLVGKKVIEIRAAPRESPPLAREAAAKASTPSSPILLPFLCLHPHLVVGCPREPASLPACWTGRPSEVACRRRTRAGREYPVRRGEQ